LQTLAINIYTPKGEMLQSWNSAGRNKVGLEEGSELLLDHRGVGWLHSQGELYGDPRLSLGHIPGDDTELNGLWDNLMALVGGSLYRDAALTAEVLPVLDRHHLKLSCRKWLGVLAYYDAAMDPSHQLSGYIARYMDVIGPVGGDRAPGMVALFERCVLPTLCDEARTAVKHGFPYFRMNHFSQHSCHRRWSIKRMS